MCEVNLLSMELAKSERDSAELRSQAAADSLMSYETDCLKRELASVQRMAKQSMARGVASYASVRIGAHIYSSEICRAYVRYLPPLACVISLPNTAACGQVTGYVFMCFLPSFPPF